MTWKLQPNDPLEEANALLANDPPPLSFKWLDKEHDYAAMTSLMEPLEEAYKAWTDSIPRISDYVGPTAETGVKFDNEKARWDLINWPTLDQVVSVLTHGARKYPSADNWRRVENGRDRYFAAAMRHLIAWRNGERIDKDSGCHHLACTIVNLMFLHAAFDGNDAK